MFDEPARSMEELAGHVTKACATLPADAQLALFGHSMGAEVAYEVSRRLAASPGRGPSALFLSGRAGPGRARSRRLGNAPDSELISELAYMGGTDATVFDDPELRELVLPAVRADFRLLEEHVVTLPPEPLDIPVRAYYGLDDPSVAGASVSAWSSVTSTHFSTRSFPGGHFYLISQRTPLLMDLFEQLG